VPRICDNYRFIWHKFGYVTVTISSFCPEELLLSLLKRSRGSHYAYARFTEIARAYAAMGFQSDEMFWCAGLRCAASRQGLRIAIAAAYSLRRTSIGSTSEAR
jgi:hypothetical protein